jgi:hypothetical protein
MRAFRLVLPALLAWLMPSLASAAIVHEATLTADSADLFVSSISVTGVGGGTDQLYIAAVATYDFSSAGATVSSISGGGLTWTLQKLQCSQRLLRAHVEIWQAYGSPGAFTADITLTGDTAVTTAAVSRYSGADSTTPTEGVAGSTSNGQNGACTGGLDDAIQTLSLTSTVDGSVHYVTTHTRNRVLSSEDADYTQRAYLDNTASGAGGAGSRTPSRGGTMAP